MAGTQETDRMTMQWTQGHCIQPNGNIKRRNGRKTKGDNENRGLLSVICPVIKYLKSALSN